MDSSPLGFFLHRILQAILEWLAVPASRGYSRSRNGTPLQYSCLENPMGGGAWWAAVHGVRKSRIRLSDFTFTFHSHGLEKEMATHSSVLAWRIPGTGEPAGLQSMGSHRVVHDWSNLAAAAAPSTLNNTWYTVQKYFQKYLLNEWISLRELVFHTTTLAEDGIIFD